MKTVLLRFYNVANLGDDLFVRILTDRYLDNFLINPRIFVSPWVSWRQRKMMKTLKWTQPLGGFFVSLIFNKARGKRFWITARNRDRADLMVYAGGSIFIEGDSLAVWGNELDVFRSMRLPYYILGANYGPVKSSYFGAIVEDIVNGSVDTCFRDQKSYEVFGHIPSARVATDMVFALDVKPFLKVEPEKKVSISVIDCSDRFDSEITGLYEQKIAECVEQLVGKGYRVELMSFCRFEGDEKAIWRIWRLLSVGVRNRVTKHFYRGDIDRTLRALSKSEIVIASRFHAMVLGLLLGKKVLPLAYSDKTFDLLSDIDFSGPIVDIRNLSKGVSFFSSVDKLQIHDISGQVALAEAQFARLDSVLHVR